MAAPTLVTGILTGGTNSHATGVEEVNAFGTDFVSEGVVGTFTNTSGVAPATGAFAVNASGTPDTNINISTGVAYVAATPTSQNSQTLRVKCSVTGTLTIAANISGSTKYDWIYISVSAANAANPNTAADNVATIVASRSSSASTDDGTPPTYGYPIAVVTVSNGFSTITNGNIRDVRTNCVVNLGSSSVTSGWTDLGYNPNTVTALGNRSYSLVFNSVDLTSTLSAGMRLKTTRLVAAPTQCTDLESGSTQYYSKTSPAGMTFTDDFTVSAWVKLESYTGANAQIASRYNGTSGWQFYVGIDGTVVLRGYNAASANYSLVQSASALPLGKWVHVAAQLDMSAFTATTTTSYVMMDGLDVPATVARAGTNPTALIQAGNLEIGGTNGGTLPFDGKLAQVAIYSAKVTQATILASIHQTLTGSETSLVSAYTFNNSISDLSANANNLTANGSAVATNADGPFGSQADGTVSATIDFGIVAKTAFSTNTTVTVQLPEGCTIPTSGGVSAVSYSTFKAPFSMPLNSDKWTITTTNTNDCLKASPATGTWYGDTGLSSTGPNISLPIGAWNVRYAGVAGCRTEGAGTQSVVVSLSTSASSESNPEFSLVPFYLSASSSPGRAAGCYSNRVNIVVTAATTYYLVARTLTAAQSAVGLYASTVVGVSVSTNTIIAATCAYL